MEMHIALVQAINLAFSYIGDFFLMFILFTETLLH
jgi:hypothetical protein